MKRMKLKPFLAGLVAMCSVSMLHTSVYAKSASDMLLELRDGTGSMTLGALEIHPGIRVLEEYNDNVYATTPVNVATKSTLLNITTPGLLVKLPVMEHELYLGYAADIYTYHRYSNEDYVAQTLNGGAALNFVGGLTVSLNNIYLETKDFRASEDDALRASHIDNTLKLTADYVFPASKLSVGFTYADSYLKYDQASNQTEDRRDQNYGMNFSYKLLPKTSITAGYGYKTVDYFNTGASISRNSNTQTMYGGVRWETTAKLSGEIQLGWSFRNYTNALDAAGNSYQDQDTEYSQISLMYQLQERTQLHLSLNRSFAESTYNGGTLISSTSGYTSTNATFGGEHYFNKKWNLNASASYSKADYEALQTGLTARNDKIYTFFTELGFAPRDWLKVGAFYDYSNTDSNDPNRKIKINQYGLTVSALF